MSNKITLSQKKEIYKQLGALFLKVRTDGNLYTHRNDTRLQKQNATAEEIGKFLSQRKIHEIICILGKSGLKLCFSVQPLPKKTSISRENILYRFLRKWFR